MSHIPERQRQRADFLIELLDTEEANRVLKRRGITDHGFLRRLRDNLAEHASIADAPRSGRDTKYTDELLEQAKDCMLEGEEAVWSMEAFVEVLIEECILPAGNSVRGFWEAFAPYMQRHGLRLVYGSQRLTFAMSSHHASERLSFCRQHVGVITATTVKDYWFTDEIQLEYGPPPNSKSGFAALSESVVHESMHQAGGCLTVPGEGFASLAQQCCTQACIPCPYVRACTNGTHK